jgi:hypothetical protein
MVAVALSSGCATTSNEQGAPPPNTALDDQPPRIVSAFFGLDDALPMRAARICLEAPGADGMPVTFSRRVVGSGFRDAEVSASAFTVITRSGAHKTPACATLAPAIESSERHTVLLVGDLGDATDDPPVRVEVTDSLPLADGADGRGLAVEVTPLEGGPTLVLAMGFGVEGLQSDCPPSAKQTVVVVWAGGVQPAEAASDHDHRGIYRVTTGEGDVVPFALGDLDDQDNYVHLCLDTDAPATRVSASGGVLVDPRGDLNPETWLDVVR